MQNENLKILNELNRNIVQTDWRCSRDKNLEMFLRGNPKGTSEYIYQNQKDDGENIINIFYTTPVRAISVIKRTKVGMDGLMIQLAYNMSTHSDDNFMIHRNNIYIITAMSNISWENELKERVPNCFQENIYHHGKLQKLKEKLKQITNAFIIIDEIDTGDKENQKLHKIMRESGIYNIDYMNLNNIRFVFVSATIINELKELYKWGEFHQCYKMTIPNNYISHIDFLNMNIIKEFYPIDSIESATKWINEDILENYLNDYRVHFIRADISNEDYIKTACENAGIKYHIHTSTDRISFEDFNKIFSQLNFHVVIIVKGFYRRANLIPNSWKIKIGSMHERFCENIDTNVQIQGLVGRMTGYWKDVILQGHKTGPYRTSINSILQYENFYENSLNFHKNLLAVEKYNTNGNKKTFLRPINLGINNEIDKQENINLDSNKHYPIILDLNILEPEFLIYYLNTKNEKIEYIKQILSGKKKYLKLLDFISNPQVKCYGFITPQTKKSYQIHITDAIRANKKKIPFSINLNTELKKYNNWQCFIDNIKNNLCVVIWTIDQYIYQS